MNSKIYIQLDFFSPTVYIKTNNSEGPIFLILQPYLFQEPAMGCPDVVEYISKLNKTPLEDFEYIILDETIPTHRDSAIWDNAIPVPLPHNVAITLNGNRINTMNGEHGYVFSSPKMQIKWMIDSKSSTSITVNDFFGRFSFVKLTSDQVDQWWNAMLVVLTNFTRKDEATNIYVGVEKNGVLVLTQAMLNNKVNPAKKSLHDLLVLIAKDKLNGIQTNFTNEKSNALQNYVAALNSISDVLKPTLLPLLELPAVKLSVKNLTEIMNNGTPEQIASFASPQLGYLKNLAAYFQQLYDKEVSEKKFETLVSSLKNYFLFGERIRVEKNTIPAEFQMLPIADVDPEEATLFATPAISLAGQVIDLTKTGDYKIGATSVLNTNFASNLAAIRKNTKENQANSFSRSLGLLSVITDSDWDRFKFQVDTTTFQDQQQAYTNLGKASFMPSNALAIQPESFPKIDDQILFQVPQSILDGLHESGRVAYTSRFAQPTPSRKTINYPADVVNYAISSKDGSNIQNHLSTFTPGLMIKVSVAEVKLPNAVATKSLYKISSKAQFIDDSLLEPALRTFITERILKDLNNFRFNLIDAKEQFFFSPLLDEKVDDDELVEIYGIFDAGQVKNQQCDLLIVPAEPNQLWQSGETHFNVLLKRAPEMRPIIIQRNYFQFKYNHSSNGLNTYIKLGLKKSPKFSPIPQEELQPVLLDHSNFNKFRVSVNDGSANPIAINKADALRPIVEYIDEGNDDSSVTSIYKVLHRFSEDLPDFTDTNGRGVFETEWNRYSLYRSAGSLHTITGKAENQYAFRLPTENTLGISLPNSTNVASLALLAIKEATGTPAYLLTYSLDPDTRKIQLTINKKYFALFRGQFDPADPKKHESGTAYRPLYEAVIDLIQAESITLYVEGWDFDNSLFNLPVEQGVHPELANEIPSHVKYLKRVSTDVTLDPTEFRASVKNIFDKPNIKEFAEVVKNFASDTTISFNCPPELAKASFVRLRLTVFRKKEKSVASNFSLDVKPEELIQEAWMPLQSDINEKIYTVAFSSIDDARAQMRKLIEPPGSGEISMGLPIGSDLFYSTAFVVVTHVGKNRELIEHPDSKKLREQLKLVLSENLAFTAFNYLLKNPVGAGPINYGDLFYVPYAIVPLKTITEIGNATETFEFAQYLIKILIAIAYPAKAIEDLHQLVGLVDWPDDPSQSQREKFRFLVELRKALRESIAPRFAELTTYVDDRDIEKDLPQNYVVLKAIYDKIDLHDIVKRYFSSLFTAKPELFLTSKGFGIGLIRNERELNGKVQRLRFDELYSIKLNKVIKHSNGTQLARQINTTFDFTSIFKADKAGQYRIFVDVLDDNMYDNEFEIIADTNSSTPGVAVKHHRRIPARDIEDNQYIPVRDGNENLNLIHYVEDWQKHFLLPSRRPPQKPVPQEVSHKVNYKNGSNPVQSPQVSDILTFEIDNMLRKRHKDYPPSTSFDSPATIAQRLKEWTSASLSPGMKKGFMTDIKTQDTTKAKWRRHDTCVSIYTFAIDADEEKTEASVATPLTGFENDRILVYWDDAATEINNTITTQLETVQIKKFRDAYQVYKKRASGQELTTEESNVQITRDDLTDQNNGLVKNLLNVLKPLHNSPQDVNKSAAGQIGHLVITKDGKLDGFNLTSDGTVLVGAVLYVDVTRLNNQNIFKYYLSLAVITHPWEHKKLRIQVDRNSRDFNSDSDPDINPMFEMFSEFSDWVDHGQVTLDYNFWDGDGLDNQQLNPYPVELTRIRFNETVQAAYDADLNDNSRKRLNRFFSELFREDLFDKAEIDKRVFSVLISHRATTNQMIELAKNCSPEFKNQFADGLKAYRDEFTKQQTIIEVSAERTDLELNEDVTSVYPFVRVMVLGHDKTPLLGVNIQVQWHSDPN